MAANAAAAGASGNRSTESSSRPAFQVQPPSGGRDVKPQAASCHRYIDDKGNLRSGEAPPEANSSASWWSQIGSWFTGSEQKEAEPTEETRSCDQRGQSGVNENPDFETMRAL
eukprot:CAMPEP_0178429640 /NCGR_PEP_ID=MMETSP0689_2-20121128/30906_1 /TAXON_ID=160604 /ORGANISM="Amphidinium massartii, Strain CS-259" /LENGTH=112 /DNA_ID=CAMNT_0020051467 /DNA_START=32 /DNA_END=367 /DNA_ORIENTATION=-